MKRDFGIPSKCEADECPVCGAWSGVSEHKPYCGAGCEAEANCGDTDEDEGALDWTDWDSMQMG
jgi:hypothetical protein